jgi:uncharacterized protein (TIGR02271 family)
MNAQYSLEQLEQYIGTRVIDKDGKDIGKLTNIYVENSGEKEPVFITVSTGWFGFNDVFVPLDGAEIAGDQIQVKYDEEMIKSAPKYDANSSVADASENELLQYYGVNYTGSDAGNQNTSNVSTDHQGDSETDTLTLHQEDVHIGKEQKETGKVRISKHIVTEEKEFKVPVTKEKVRITTTDVSDKSPDAHELNEQSVEFTTSEEEVHLTKEVRPTQQVNIEKIREVNEHNIKAQASHEELDVDDEGNNLER